MSDLGSSLSKTVQGDFIENRIAAPSQAHWPTERAAVIREARAACNGEWPAKLESGVMFFMGERITRAEFERQPAE